MDTADNHSENQSHSLKSSSRIHGFKLFPNAKYRNAIINLAMVAASIFFTFVLIEIVLRIDQWRSIRNGNSPDIIQLDDTIGWVAQPGVRSQVLVDGGNQPYQCDARVDSNSFRLFGDVATDRTKLVVLGDSYTHAMDVSDDKTYYYLLGKRLDMELFASGTGGYSTLQEYLTLDRWFDRIQPDLVLLQLCHNDIINNTFRLESQSALNNNRMLRPYLNPDGGITYALPMPFPWLRHYGSKYSRFMDRLFFAIDKATWNLNQSVEYDIAVQGNAHQAYREAYEITSKIFSQFKTRCGDVPVYAFCVDVFQPYYSDFNTLCETNGIRFIDGVAGAIRSASDAGEIVNAYDGAHWNERGHELCADVLIEYFMKR